MTFSLKNISLGSNNDVMFQSEPGGDHLPHQLPPNPTSRHHTFHHLPQCPRPRLCRDHPPCVRSQVRQQGVSSERGTL